MTMQAFSWWFTQRGCWYFEIHISRLCGGYVSITSNDALLSVCKCSNLQLRHLINGLGCGTKALVLLWEHYDSVSVIPIEVSDNWALIKSFQCNCSCLCALNDLARIWTFEIRISKICGNMTENWELLLCVFVHCAIEYFDAFANDLVFGTEALFVNGISTWHCVGCRWCVNNEFVRCHHLFPLTFLRDNCCQTRCLRCWHCFVETWSTDLR